MSISRREFLKSMVSAGAAAALLSVRPLLAQDSRQWHTTGLDLPALRSIDDVLRGFMQERGIPNGSLAITRRGKLVFARGYSWTDNAAELTQPDSLFRIASLSKPITSAAIFSLVEKNQLKLSDKLADILTLTPQRGKKLAAQLDKITVEHLLQHLGGWNRDKTFDPMFYDVPISTALKVDLPISRQQIVTYMNDQNLQSTPGTAFSYSNYGYCLLGRIIEAITSQPYASYVRSALLQPLRIQRMKLGASLLSKRQPGEVLYYTSYKGTRPSVLHPGQQVPMPYGSFNLENMDSHGGWLASAIDLVRFAASFDASASSPILKPATIARIFAQPAIGPNPDKSFYANGWMVRPAGKSINTWHNGSLPGTTTLLVRRWDGFDWAVLFNQRDDPSGKSYDAIDGLMHVAVDSVTTWPDHDLFDQYL